MSTQPGKSWSPDPEAQRRGRDGGRVVVLHVRVLADRGGGPEKTILAGPAHFRGTPYRLVAAYMHPPGSDGFERLALAADRAGCEMIGIPDRGLFDVGVLVSLVRLCRRYSVAVWHAHDYKSDVLGLIVRRFHRMRLVTTLHGWVDLGLRNRFYFLIDRLCLRGYERVFAVSPDLARRARRHGVDSNRLSMLRNGIDPAVFRRRSPPGRAELRRQLAVPADRLVVATIGRLVPGKGLLVVLDAWSRLSRTGGEAELWVVGEGPERQRLEAEAARLGIAERVRFLGYREDVRPVLEASDAYMSGSWGEGIPNSILEALAMEVSVVATDVGGVAELIDDGRTGFLCSAGDAAALADRLQRLLDGPELRASLAAEGRRMVASEFSLADRMRTERAAYDRLLAGA